MDSRSWPPDSADGPWGAFQRATTWAWFGTPNHQAQGVHSMQRGHRHKTPFCLPHNNPKEWRPEERSMK